MTVVPAVPLGTRNVHENVPLALAVSDPDVQLETRTPSNIREAKAVEAENPVPETVTLAPTGPSPGDTVIAGVVTVKTPFAV